MPAHMLAASPTIFLTIAADTTDYNIFAAAGSPGVRVDVVLTINAGVTVYQTSANGAIVTTVSGGFAAGSTLKIVNNGTICGRGGDAGNGGAPVAGSGTSGGTGFHAIYLAGATPTTIDNTNGNIFGGGGGGGGGGGSGVGGGGGGGGRGRLGGAHGVHGGSGADGTDGSFSGAGTGGLTGAGHGGDGGDWGQPGNAGLAASGSAGSGGPAGKAIALNGATLTWAGGNNSTQVKGAVA